MPQYKICAVSVFDKYTDVEAPDEDTAIKLAMVSDDFDRVGRVCHHCSGEVGSHCDPQFFAVEVDGAVVEHATPEEKLRARIVELEAELAAVTGPGSSTPSTELWDAIHTYTRACGGDPDTGGYGNLTRQRAVVAVESAVAQLSTTSRNSE